MTSKVMIISEAGEVEPECHCLWPAHLCTTCLPFFNRRFGTNYKEQVLATAAAGKIIRAEKFKQALEGLMSERKNNHS